MAFQQQDWAQAERLLQQALQAAPHHPLYHNGLGNLYLTCQQPEQAICHYQMALKHQPGYQPALQNLVQWYVRGEQWQRALTLLETHGPLVANWPDGTLWQGMLADKLHNFVRAQQAYDDYLKQVPGSAYAHRLLGHLYQRYGALVQAFKHYQQSLSLAPHHPESLFLLGTLLQQHGQLMGAIAHYESLLQQPQVAFKSQILNNLGCCWRDMGYPEKGHPYFDQAVALDGNDAPRIASNRLICLFSDPSLNRQELDHAFMDWGERYGAPFYPAHQTWSQTCEIERPLRIGYVLPSFMHHATLQHLTPILLGHDAGHFHVCGYSDVIVPDANLALLQAHCVAWQETAGWDDDAVSARIQSDHIDILVDLAGHMVGHRLLVFARRPAPIQVTGLTFPYTSGLKTMDYIFLHDALLQSVTGAVFTEQCYPVSCFYHWAPPAGDAISTQRVGMAEQPFPTLGCANQTGKFNAVLLQWWSEILRRVPNAHLRLKAAVFQETQAKALYLNRFNKEGIDPQRIELLGHTPSLEEHFNFYQHLDVALDPFPYTGSMSTCDALWMGVPVITLAGGANMSTSLLGACELNGWIAQSPEAYIAKVVDLVQTPSSNTHREQLRTKFLTSPVCQSDATAKELERAYRWMWQQWCQSHEQTNTNPAIEFNGRIYG